MSTGSVAVSSEGISTEISSGSSFSVLSTGFFVSFFFGFVFFSVFFVLPCTEELSLDDLRTENTGTEGDRGVLLLLLLLLLLVLVLLLVVIGVVEVEVRPCLAIGCICFLFFCICAVLSLLIIVGVCSVFSCGCEGNNCEGVSLCII